MAEVKNYGLSGVHRTVQLGKQGPILVGNADTDSFSVTTQDAATLTNMSGANATNSAHFITKAQLDVVYTEAVFKANVNYNDSSPILLGNISSGTKTIITTLTIGTAFDDANAIVTIGTSGNNTLLMSDDYCEIENTGVYQTINTVEIASDTALNIYVTQAGATAGAGNVLVSVVDGPVVDGGTINYGAGSGGIALGDLSVTSNSPSGNGSLTYNNSTGVFTFTPADANAGGIGLTALSVTSNSPSGNGSLSYSNTTGVFTFTPANLSSIVSNYGNSNVTTLLSSFGSNTITTTGNISGSNISATGTAVTGIAAITAGVTNTLLPNTVASFSANVNNYTQVTLQNKSSGADATADFVITANNGSDTVNYADFGIINSGYDNTTPTNSLGNIVFAADTYLYAQGNAGATSQSGGNIAIGTTVTGKTVKIFAGGANSTAIVGTFSNTGLAVNGNVTATNLSGNITITGNVTGTSPNVTLVAGSYNYTFDNSGTLTLPTGINGNEGGEIAFTQAANSTLAGNTVVLDQYVDRIRFFEGGGNARGAYIDLSIAPDGVGALLNNRISGFVNAGTDVTLGNLKARIPSSGNRSLQVSTVSGSYSVYGSAQYTAGGTIGGTNIVSGFAVSVTTTPAYLSSGNNFLTAGDAGQWIIMDPAAGLAWRISFIIGASFNNNMICIERLV